MSEKPQWITYAIWILFKEPFYHDSDLFWAYTLAYPHVTTIICSLCHYLFFIGATLWKMRLFYGVPTNLTLLSIDASFKRESYKMAAKEKKNEPPLQLDV